MPRLARMCFLCMVIGTPVVIVLEIIQHLRYSSEKGIGALLEKASGSALIWWAFFAAVLIIVSLVQLRRIKKGHVETRYINLPLGDDSDPFVSVANPEPKYLKYIKTAAVGALACAVLFTIFKLV